MTRNGFLPFALAAVVAGCVTASPTVPKASVRSAATTISAPVERSFIATIEPARVIHLAAEAAPKGALVRSQFMVQATGAEGDLIYLNSERDYRDQRNLTVVITPTAAKTLSEAYGPDLRITLQGRSVTATGVAKRVTVWFTVLGRRTDKYYYQTQLVVSDPRQIQVGSNEG